LPSPLVQVSAQGTITADADALPGGRSAFAARHVLRLPALLSPSLFRVLGDELATAAFAAVDRGFYAEERLERCALWNHLVFLANDPALFRVIEHLTGCDPIGSFMGRVYKRSPDGHFDDWHSDTAQDRLIGMSVNLGSEPYEGGALRLRERATQHVVFDGANVGRGDAVLFRISTDLEHMVTAVEGRVPRTAFAGWFRRAPDFRDTMLKPLAPASSRPPGARPPLPRRLRVAGAVAFHAVDDDLVVHGLANDALVRLGPSGRRVWELVAERQDVTAVLAALSAEYDAPPGEVERDARRLLDDVLALGLLEAA
jgi:hypothetical protein